MLVRNLAAQASRQLVTTIPFQFRTSKRYENRLDVRNYNAIVLKRIELKLKVFIDKLNRDLVGRITQMVTCTLH